MQKIEQDKVATFRFIFLAELLGLKVVVTRLLPSNRLCCHGSGSFEKNKAHGHQDLFAIISTPQPAQESLVTDREMWCSIHGNTC